MKSKRHKLKNKQALQISSSELQIKDNGEPELMQVDKPIRSKRIILSLPLIFGKDLSIQFNNSEKIQLSAQINNGSWNIFTAPFESSFYVYSIFMNIDQKLLIQTYIPLWYSTSQSVFHSYLPSPKIGELRINPSIMFSEFINEDSSINMIEEYVMFLEANHQTRVQEFKEFLFQIIMQQKNQQNLEWKLDRIEILEPISLQSLLKKIEIIRKIKFQEPFLSNKDEFINERINKIIATLNKEVCIIDWLQLMIQSGDNIDPDEVITIFEYLSSFFFEDIPKSKGKIIEIKDLLEQISKTQHVLASELFLKQIKTIEFQESSHNDSDLVYILSNFKQYSYCFDEGMIQHFFSKLYSNPIFIIFIPSILESEGISFLQTLNTLYSQERLKQLSNIDQLEILRTSLKVQTDIGLDLSSRIIRSMLRNQEIQSESKSMETFISIFKLIQLEEEKKDLLVKMYIQIFSEYCQVHATINKILTFICEISQQLEFQNETKINEFQFQLSQPIFDRILRLNISDLLGELKQVQNKQHRVIQKGILLKVEENEKSLVDQLEECTIVVNEAETSKDQYIIELAFKYEQKLVVLYRNQIDKSELLSNKLAINILKEKQKLKQFYNFFHQQVIQLFQKISQQFTFSEFEEQVIKHQNLISVFEHFKFKDDILQMKESVEIQIFEGQKYLRFQRMCLHSDFQNNKLFSDQKICDSFKRVHILNESKVFYEAYHLLSKNQIFLGYLNFLKEKLSYVQKTFIINEEIDFVFSGLIIFINGITQQINAHKPKMKNQFIFDQLTRVFQNDQSIDHFNCQNIVRNGRLNRLENFIQIFKCLKQLSKEGFGKYVSENIHFSREKIESVCFQLFNLNELDILLDQFDSILKIANIFQVDLQSIKNYEFMRTIKDLEIQQNENITVRQLVVKFQTLQLYPKINLQNFSKQFQLFIQMGQLINFSQSQKGINFLDLREYVEEDDFEMNSILIKFGKHQKLIDELTTIRDLYNRKQLFSIQELFRQLIDFEKKYLGGTTIVELWECLANLQKVQNLQNATQKKEQLGKLCCDIMSCGIYTFQLINKSLKFSITCNQENLTEQRIREIYSRVHISQSALRKQKDDHWIQERSTQVNNLKQQWKVIQQIKSVLITLVSYGNTEKLVVPIIFKNSQSIPFNQQQEKIAQQLKILEQFLEGWKRDLPRVLSQYPHLSLFGFSQYHDLCFNQDLQNCHQVLKILQTMGILNYSSSYFQGVQIQLKQVDKLQYIGKIIQSKTSIKLGSDSLRPQMNSPKMITYLPISSEETMSFLINQMVVQGELRPKFYQFFICESHMTKFDLELFLLRCEYFVQETSKSYFLIFPNRSYEQAFISSSLELISALLSKESQLRNHLYIITPENNFLKNIRNLQPSNLLDIMNSSISYSLPKANVEFVYSEYPGEGKTFYIKSQMASLIRSSIRIPTYSSTKARIIELLKKQPNVGLIHIDLYENPEIDLNYLLFELLYLNSLSINNEIIFLNNPKFYVEISNTVRNRLFESLSIIQKNTKTQIKFNINVFQTQYLSQKQQQNVLACFTYLRQISNPKAINNVKSDIIPSFANYHLSEFQNLISAYFLNKFNKEKSKPCFYQILRFINLFGSEMIKFTNSRSLEINKLRESNISQLRSYVVSQLYEQALRLSIQIEEPDIQNRLSQDSQNLPMSLQIAKLLEKKANSIEHLNSLQMDFVTFQENQTNEITSFFLKSENIPFNIIQLNSIENRSQLILDNKQVTNTPEKLKNWLKQLVQDNRMIQPNAPKNESQKQTEEMVNSFTIQRDNFFKTIVVFMMLRAESSTILMGESGIGKTALMALLSSLMNTEFEVMQIHAGITENQVETKMVELINKARNQPNKKFQIFFDELNTCKLVGGLFKEIMMDRCLFGEKLPDNIIPLGAMNPYKLKTEKMRDMESLHINGSMRRHLHDEMKSSHLQFTVEPLPESMFNIVKNFHELSQSDEKFYTSSIIDLRSQALRGSHFFNTIQLSHFSQAVHTCQRHLKNVMDSSSSCSLRDVKRATNLFFWFATFQKKISDSSIKQIDSFEFCASLSLWIVYIVRLPKVALRKELYALCQGTFENLKQTINIERVIDKVSAYVAHQCSIPQANILKNSALNQNLLALLISIQNRIPVILIGPPGSSKTLSLQIIINSMKGDQSKNEFFGNFMAVMPSTYQGHVESTSARLVEVFENASQKQQALKQQKQDNKYVQLVCFEEIGLAEMSPHNPLKTLHPILENPEYSIVSVSNWPLDQSKMNRMISVYRLDTSEDELLETMIRQMNIIYYKNKPQIGALNKDQELILRRIIRVYLTYLDSLQMHAKDFHQFHGMRDFYGMIRMYFRDRLLVEGGGQKILRDSNQSATDSFMRHMQGYPLIKEHLIVALSKHNFSLEVPENDYELIMDNLKESYVDFTSRHLMIVTPNPSIMIDFIKEQLRTLQKPYQVILGSGFELDKGQDRSFEVLHRIIACVESGEIMILSNLDTVYQSLYELVNQNYRMSHGAAQCSLSLGSEMNHFEVSPQFKLIIIIPKDQVPNNIDGPLLNRFEKHYLDPQSLNQDRISERNRLIDYFTKKVDGKEKLTFSNIDEIITNLHYNSPELSIEEIKQSLFHMSTFKAALLNNHAESRKYFEKYIRSGYHFGFTSFISKRINQWQDTDSKNNMFFVTSFDQYLKQESPKYMNLNLSLIDSAAKFDKELEKFESLVEKSIQSNPATDPIILIIQCTPEETNQIAYIQHRMAEQNFKVQERIKGLIGNNQVKPFQKFAMIIIMQVEANFKLPLLNKGWEFFHIEELFPLSMESCYQTSLNLSVMINKKTKHLKSVIRLETMIHEYISIHENVVKAYRSFLPMIKNPSIMVQTRLNQFIELICLKNNTSFFAELINFMIQIIVIMVFAQLCLLNIFTVEEFLINYVFIRKREEIGIMNQICLSIKQLIHNSLVYFMITLEESALIFPLTQSKYEASKITKFLEIFKSSLGVQGLNLQNLDINDDLIAIITPKIQSRQLDCFYKDYFWQHSIKIFEHLEGFITRCSDDDSNQFQLSSLDNSVLSVFKLQEWTYIDLEKDLTSIMNEKCAKRSSTFTSIANMMTEKYIFKSHVRLPKLMYQFVIGQLNEEEILKIEGFIQKYTSPNIISFAEILKFGLKPVANGGSNFLKEFTVFAVKEIAKQLEPSNQLINIVFLNALDYKELLSSLLYSIEDFNITYECDQVIQNITFLQMAENLIPLKFQLQAKESFNFNWKELRELNQTYFENIRILLLNKYSIRERMYLREQVNSSNQIQVGKMKQNELNEKLNTFFLEVIDYVIQITQWNNQTLLENLLQIIGEVEDIQRKQVESEDNLNTGLLPSQKIKISQIMKVVMNKLTQEINLLGFYDSCSFIAVREKTTSESPCMLILSEVIQINMVAPAFKKRRENELIDLLLRQYLNLKSQHPIQQAILLAIFRVSAKKGIKASEKGNYKLKNFFQKSLSKPFQNYIVKLFQVNEDLGEDMKTRISNSFHFNKCYWLDKIEKNNFSNKNKKNQIDPDQKLITQILGTRDTKQLSSIVQIIKQILVETSSWNNNQKSEYSQRRNAFVEIYSGQLEERYYYPLMMYNNISYLKTISDDHNNQLYKCSGCSEFIFSDACPDLKTINYPCARCGILLRKQDNVLKWVNQHLNEFKALVNREQWPGFYLNIYSKNFKIDSGRAIHLRIAGLLYFCSIKFAFERSFYNLPFYYQIHNSSRQSTSLQINKILKISYSANPNAFIKDQIDLMISHIEQELSYLHVNQADHLLLLTKLANQLINDSSIVSKSQQADRLTLNLRVVEQIDRIISEFKTNISKQNMQKQIYNEQDTITYSTLISEYRRSLRTINPDYSAEQIKESWLKQFGNNEYVALKYLLTNQDLDFLRDVLPSLLKFAITINSRFSRKFSQKDAQKLSLLQIVGNNPRNWIYRFYQNKVIPAWSKVRQVLKEFQVGCKVYQIYDLTLNTRFSELVFGQDSFDSQFQKILTLVCNMQNENLEKFYQNCMSDSSPKTQELKQYVKTILFDSKTQKIRSKTLGEINPSFNTVRKLHINILTKYAVSDIEYAAGTEIVEDLVSVQEAIVSKVLLGAVKIDLAKSNRFQFLEDLHQIGLLENIKINQVEISDVQRSIFRTVKSFKIAQEVLSHLSTLFVIFKNESTMAESSIQSKLTELKISQGWFEKSLFPESLKLKHLTSSMKVFEEDWMDKLILNCSPEFMQNIDQRTVSSAIIEIRKFKQISEFVIALGRLIIRILCQTPASVKPEGLLFETLFEVDISGEFWDDPSKLEDNYSTISKNQIKFGQAYHLYLTSKSLINRR